MEAWQVLFAISLGMCVGWYLGFIHGLRHGRWNRSATAFAIVVLAALFITGYLMSRDTNEAPPKPRPGLGPAPPVAVVTGAGK